jgi:hypothetical protein
VCVNNLVRICVSHFDSAITNSSPVGLAGGSDFAQIWHSLYRRLVWVATKVIRGGRGGGSMGK